MSLLPHELGERLVQKSATKFVADHKETIHEFFSFIILKIAKIYFRKDTSSMTIKDINSDCLNWKSHSLKHGETKIILRKIINDIAQQFPYRKIYTEYSKANSMNEYSHVGILLGKMNQVYRQFTLTIQGIKLMRKSIDHQMQDLNIFFKEHLFVRYMTRDNQLCSNQFFTDIDDLLLIFFPILLLLIGRNVGFPINKRLIILPMSSGLCFGYVVYSTNKGKMPFITYDGLILHRKYINNFNIVISTYLNYDSMGDVKSKLYKMFREYLTKHRAVLTNGFYNYFIKIQNEYNYDDNLVIQECFPESILLDLKTIIHSGEWKHIEEKWRLSGIFN